jgi:hypothetical protein
MRAAQPVIWAVAAVTSCLLLSACGDGEKPDAAQAPPERAGTSSGLGGARFRAIDAVYVASLPIDQFQDERTVDPRAFASATRPAIAACDALDRDDPLLGAIARMCPLVLRFSEQLLHVGPCADADADRCLDVVDDMRRTVARFKRLGRHADRVIARADLKPACQRALTTRDLAYAVFDGYARALALFERGLTNGSGADVEEAQRVLTRSAAKGRALPDAKQSLALFRSGCA